MFDVIFKNEHDDIYLCKQQDFNVIRCTINTDFTDEYPKNGKVASIETSTFYSWGMIEDSMLPSQNISFRNIWERLEDTAPAPKQKTEPKNSGKNSYRVTNLRWDKLQFEFVHFFTLSAVCFHCSSCQTTNPTICIQKSSCTNFKVCPILAVSPCI